MTKCPSCVGGNLYRIGKPGSPVVIKCDVCNGSNEVSNLTLAKIDN